MWHIAESSFSQSYRLRGFYKKGQSADLKEPVADGELDRRGLSRGLHIDHLTFRRIVMTLHMCDAIIEESEYGKNTVYTLKDAA